MAIDFSSAPYYDDYLSSPGGLSKNYYRVLFRPGRALQARELTTAQTILQNQIGSFGKHFFPKGSSIYGGEKTLHNPMPYVKLESGVETTSAGDGFTNIQNGSVLVGGTSGVKAVVQFAMPAEGSSDQDTIWVQYISANTSANTITFTAGESLFNANTDTSNSSNEVASVASALATGEGHGISVESSIVFTKDAFVHVDTSTILLEKYSIEGNNRIGYVMTERLVGSVTGSQIDIIDTSLKDNAQGYPNYSADGADRYKIELILCSLGSDSNWVSDHVPVWLEGNVYHKNAKVKLSSESNEVFICVESHTSTTGVSGNAPVSGNDNDYWSQAINFIEIARTETISTTSGVSLATIYTPSMHQSEAGFSQSTYDAILKIIEDRHYKTHGSFTVVPFGLTISNNDKNGIKLANGSTTVANAATVLASVESGHAFHQGHEIITQLPENFVLDRARTSAHTGITENHTPEINYGNYILVDNLFGYFDTTENETVAFYNANTSTSSWDDEANKVATAKIRYFSLHSGRKSESGNTESEFYPKYRSYIYDLKGIVSGEMRAMKGLTYGGSTDTDITNATISQTVDGQVNVITSNVYAKLYESGAYNTSIFPLNPGFLKEIQETNSAGEPIFYTTKMVDAQLVKDVTSNTYHLFSASSNTYFTESDFGSEVGNGIVNPANEVDLADANYTIYNMSGTEIVMDACGNPFSVENGDIIPADYIAGESGCNFSWDGGNLDVRFISDTAGTHPLLTDIKLAIKVGLTSVVPNTKTYNPCQTILCSNVATSSIQGYDSNVIYFPRPDVYSVGAIYMSLNGTSTPELPTVDFSTYSGTFLVGEKVKEYDTSGKETGVSGFIVENTTGDTWTFIPAAGSKEGNYFTDTYTIIGMTSGSIGILSSSVTLNDGERDITSRYELVSGQKDNYYGWSYLRLKKQQQHPTGQIIVVYNTLDATYNDDTSTYFSINSYGSFNGNNIFTGNSVTGSIGLKYEELPIYGVSGMGDMSLRDCIDFRSIRESNTSVTDLSTLEFSEINNRYWDTEASLSLNQSPVTDDLFKVDYSYFKSQKGMVVLNKEYDFEIVMNTPGKSGYPDKPDGSMILWKINIPPYTAYPDEIDKTYVDNRRYTMKDIGHLDSRISALETAVKLNTAEIKALQTPVRSISDLYQGLERFKNGIFVDTFDGHSKGDVRDPDYKCSIDTDMKMLRSPFESRSIELDVISSSQYITYHPVHSKTYDDNGIEVTNNDGIVTLKYTHTPFITQDNFTTSINVNPYNVSTFVGSVILDPESDNWMDTDRIPSVEINLEGDADAWDALVSGVNERLEVTLNTTPLYAVGTQVRTTNGGTGKVVGTEGNIVTLTDHEGRYAIGTSLIGVKSDGSSFSATIQNTQTLGGATGFGTQFGDWQTNWTGTDTKKDVVDQTSLSRTLSYNVQVARRVWVSSYASYRGYWTTQMATETRYYDQAGTRTVDRVTTTTKNIDSAAGVRSDLSTEVRKQELGDKIVDVSIVPFIRENMVMFDCRGLKPSTKHIPYFNGIEVSEHCAPRAEMLSPGATWTFNNFGDNLITDAKGTFKGVFRIPAGVFRTGERKFRFIDVTNPLNTLDKAKSFAEAMYTASGMKQTIQGQVVSTRVPVINQKNLSTEKMVTSTDTSFSTSICWGDPLAQTFLVDPSRIPNGVFVTALDIWISAKPTTTELPIWIDIRSTENGYPSQVTVPSTKVMYDMNDEIYSATRNASGLIIKTLEEHKILVGQPITILNDTNYTGTYTVSTVNSRTEFIIDASQLSSSSAPASTISFTKINIATETNGWTPTRFVFEYPIYLNNGEYAFVVQSNSDEYECYIAEIGGNSLRNGETMTQQPYAGVMFKSQNASTWTASQESDLAFKLWRASFDDVHSGEIVFNQNDVAMRNIKGFSGDVPSNLKFKFNSVNFQSDVLNTTPTNIAWYQKTMDTNEALAADWSETSLSTDIDMKNTKIVKRGSESLKLKALMSTNDNYVSPVIDLTDQRVILVENIINAPTSNDVLVSDVSSVKSMAFKEYGNDDGFAQSKYISRSIVLDEGMDANDMRVTLQASRRRSEDSKSFIDVYMKIQSSIDNSMDFIERYWYPMVLVSDPGYSTGMVDWKKYEYKPAKNFWVIDDGGTKVTYYTGDGLLWGGGYIEYNEANASNFIDTNTTPLEHYYYDEQEEVLYYTYFNGNTFNGSNLEELKVATYDSFKQYSIKIVMMSTNKSLVPLINEAKAIALT